MTSNEEVLPLVDTEAKYPKGIGHEGLQLRRDALPSPPSPFDVESSAASRVRERQQHHRVVGRPSRGLHVAKPVPFEPITDPFAFVCDIARRPKFGHQYVLCPERSRKRGDRRIGLSVGPHWSGVVYTMSMIGMITLFVANYLIGPDVAQWCQPVIYGCSMLTLVFLLATAVADPGIGERPAWVPHDY